MNQHPFIPYFTTSRYRVEAMVRLSQVEKHDRVADLGSGDGRIAIAFAHQGASVTGYELDSSLIEKSEQLIKLEKLEDRIEILKKDFWDEDLSQFDVITIYPMPDIMQDLEKKLLQEAKKGTKILTNYYPFPHWQYTTEQDHIYLYLIV